MALYLISYDLKKATGHNYEALHKKIASFGESLHVLESTFVVKTQKSAKQMSDEIHVVYKPEHHLVIKITNSEYWGRLTEGYWDWIQARF